MYPLMHFIMKSNMKDDLGVTKPGQLLSKIFEILESLVLERPQHI